MKNIVINYSVDGDTKTASFPDNRKGNSQSIKFIEALHKQRKLHYYYYRLNEIERLQTEFKAATGKKKNKLESDLYFAQKDRDELFDLLGIDFPEPPSLLKIEIFKMQ